MEYTWKITNIKTADTADVADAIVQTYWTKTGTDENGNEGTFTGATPFALATVNPDTFVPLSSLTEETVLSWIQGVVVNDYEEHVNGQIQKQIDLKIVKEVKMPWAPEEIVEPIV